MTSPTTPPPIPTDPSSREESHTLPELRPPDAIGSYADGVHHHHHQISQHRKNSGENPTHNEDFKWQLPDCRFLGDPIDLLTFNGLYLNKIDSISFIEVKSGKARLNKHQKLVKEAVEDNRVKYRVF